MSDNLAQWPEGRTDNHTHWITCNGFTKSFSFMWHLYMKNPCMHMFACVLMLACNIYSYVYAIHPCRHARTMIVEGKLCQYAHERHQTRREYLEDNHCSKIYPNRSRSETEFGFSSETDQLTRRSKQEARLIYTSWLQHSRMKNDEIYIDRPNACADWQRVNDGLKLIKYYSSRSGTRSLYCHL